MTLSLNNNKLNFKTFNLAKSFEIKPTNNFNNNIPNVIGSSLNTLSSYNKPFISFKESLSLADFEKTLSDSSYYRFNPDKYQKEAAKSIFLGNNLIVTAPTGTGKTLIAEYAIRNALNKNNGHQKRVFYTSPLKALSNYHYNHFKSLYGENNVGIITGERKENINAPIMVMTTEVYRNMVYNNEYNSQLKDLDSIIFDEFHYMNDPDRGSVWEESMLLTPKHVKKIMLSATIGNYGQIQNWLNSLENHSIAQVDKKNTDLVQVAHSERNVPLEYFIFHSLPATDEVPNKHRPLILSKLTKEYINFENLKSDFIKNNVNEVQKFELKNFYNLISKNGEYISNKLKETNNKVEILGTLLKDKNNSQLNLNSTKTEFINFLNDKDIKLQNFLEAVKKLSDMDSSLIQNILQTNNIEKLYDILALQNHSEIPKLLVDTVSSFNQLIKSHRNYDIYGHNLFTSIKSSNFKDLIQKLSEELTTNKNEINFIRALPDESIVNMNGTSSSIVETINSHLFSSLRDKKALSFILNSLSQDLYNTFDDSIKQEHLIQDCINIANNNSLTKKEDLEKLINILQQEKRAYKSILNNVKELFTEPKELSKLLEHLNITSLSDIQELSKHDQKSKYEKLLTNIVNSYFTLNKITINSDELGMTILTNIINQNSNQLISYLEEKIKNSEDSIAFAISVKPKVTDHITIQQYLQNELSKIFKEKRSLGITDLKSQEKIRELNDERKILQKSLITLAKISTPDNDNINIADISSIISVKKAEAEKLKEKLKRYLPIEEEKANRLALVMSSKEQKEIANPKPMQRNAHIPPSQIIKFLKTYKAGSFLPLIYFIFSKHECNSAVEFLLKSNENLLVHQEKLDVEDEIKSFLHNNRYFSDLLNNESHYKDKKLQRFTTFIDGLKHGYAVHHKGLLPPQKELVEKLFSKKLLKVVFATETIAAGLDFPAKTVVIDSLEQPYMDYEILPANKFHQISGRAGRRGKDFVGNVIVMNNVNNAKGLTFNLINSPPNNIDSNFKLTYGLTLEMLKNNKFVDPENFFKNTFAVFQSDKPQSKRDFSQKNDVLFDIEDAVSLINQSQVIFKKRDKTGKVDLYLKNKREKCINQLAKSDYCINRYDVDSPEKINAQFNKQKQILTHLLGALAQYDFLFQKNFKDENFNAIEKEKLNNQKLSLIEQLNFSISILNNTHQKLHLSKEEKRLLKDDIGDQYENKLIENREYLKKLRECSFTLPFCRDEYISYQITLLNHIKAKLLSQDDKSHNKTFSDNDNIAVLNDESRLTALCKEFEKRLGVLSFPSEENESIDSLVLPDNGHLKLSKKGLIASKIHGVNEIIASELVFGDNAFLKDLSPKEIAAVVSTMVSNISPENIDKISSRNLSIDDILPENAKSVIQKIQTRASELEKLQIKVGLKGNGSKVPVVDNLVNAVYDWTNLDNRFENVFNNSITTKPDSYLPGDFAELIFRTIDLLKQLRNSLPKEDIDMKLKIQSAINLLIKPPLSSSIIDEHTADTFRFISTLYGNTNHRTNFKNLPKEDIDIMIDHIREGVDEQVKNELYSYINTSIGSLKDFDEALRILFDKELQDKVLSMVTKRSRILHLYKNQHISPLEIAETLKLSEPKVKSIINSYNFDNENANFKQLDNAILKSILLDGGYVFEQIARKKLEKEFLIRAKDFYNKKNIPQIDDNYVKENFRIITNHLLEKNDSSGHILGEIDLLVFDRKTSKVLLVSEFKANGSDILEGYNQRLSNIHQYNTGQVFPNKKVSIGKETIQFNENSFKWNPEVYVASTVNNRNTSIPEKHDNVILLPFDKVDICFMAAILCHELKKQLQL